MATKTKSSGKTTKKTTKKPASNKAKKKAVPSTEFALFAPGANEVFLAGDFNAWQSDAKDYRMRKFKGDIWKKKVKLKPGRYEYQFVVDGNWWSDPANENSVASPYGTENSIINVK